MALLKSRIVVLLATAFMLLMMMVVWTVFSPANTAGAQVHYNAGGGNESECPAIETCDPGQSFLHPGAGND